MIFLKALLAVGACLHAAGLSYLPRNEDVEMVSRNRRVVLREFYCDAAQRLIERAQSCQECMMLKVTCPDCCLASPSSSRPFEAIRCTAIGDPYGADPSLACNATSRFDLSCSQANLTQSDINVFLDCRTTNIPRAQRRGCPSLTPEDPGAHRVVPDFEGCGPYFGDFEGDYFDVLPATGAGGPPRATPTSDYEDFVDACRVDADKREQCAKDARCCKASVCGSGYDARCIDVDCKTRVARWERANRKVETVGGAERECHQLTNGDCVALSEEAQNCLTDISGGTCGNCFRRIYDDFAYKFVPRSGEKFVLMWKLYTTSVGSSSQSDYFYSKIHVEDSKGDIVASSPVHQKVFAGSFGVFSTIAVTPDMLKTGEEYYARLYYFINENTAPGVDLQMEVNGAEIVAIRARE